MRECEGIGKNIEQAINNALLELKAAREDVEKSQSACFNFA